VKPIFFLVEMLAAGLIGSAVLASGYTTDPVRWGDSDCNNSVSVRDVGYVMQYLGVFQKPRHLQLSAQRSATTRPLYFGAASGEIVTVPAR